MANLSEVVDKLKVPGAIGVIPTDTVYGLVARASDEAAVRRLYSLKKREDKPGTIIAANIEQLEGVGLKHRYLKAVEQFWPGPIGVIIPCSDPALKYLHRGKMSLAVRIPDDKSLQKFLQTTGPLMTSSVNHSGQPPATTTQEAKNYFGDQVDFYVNSGDLSDRQPSTIIRIVDDAIEIIRQGAAKIDESGRLIK